MVYVDGVCTRRRLSSDARVLPAALYRAGPSLKVCQVD